MAQAFGLTLRVALAGDRRRCAASSNRLFVCRQYEWHDDSQQWYRSYGNENWEFNEQGFMMRRFREHQRSADPARGPYLLLALGPKAL
jgi:hypothetical protein